MKVRITISLDKEIVDKIKEDKQDISRSLYINRVIKDYFEKQGKSYHREWRKKNPTKSKKIKQKYEVK